MFQNKERFTPISHDVHMKSRYVGYHSRYVELITRRTRPILSHTFNSNCLDGREQLFYLRTILIKILGNFTVEISNIFP